MYFRPLHHPFRHAVRLALTVFYFALSIAGWVGATWPTGPDFEPWAMWGVRLSGLAVLLLSLLAAVAHLTHRWITEMQISGPLGLGVLVYGGLMLVHLEPARQGVLVAVLLVAALAALATRGVSLLAAVSEHRAVRRGE